MVATRGTDRRGRAAARGAGSSWSPRRSRCVGATPMLNTATADTAPATFVVTSLDDVNDGTCNTAHCSLREAMTAAGATTDADRIEFAVTGTITPTTMLPTIFRPVEIDGGRRAGLHRSADDRPRREHDDELGRPRREQGRDGSRPRVLELADGHLAVVGKRAAVQLRRHRRDGYGRRAEPDRRFDRLLREHRRRDRSALRQRHLRQRSARRRREPATPTSSRAIGSAPTSRVSRRSRTAIRVAPRPASPSAATTTSSAGPSPPPATLSPRTRSTASAWRVDPATTSCRATTSAWTPPATPRSGTARPA